MWSATVAPRPGVALGHRYLERRVSGLFDGLDYRRGLMDWLLAGRDGLGVLDWHLVWVFLDVHSLPYSLVSVVRSAGRFDDATLRTKRTYYRPVLDAGLALISGIDLSALHQALLFEVIEDRRSRSVVAEHVIRDLDGGCPGVILFF